MNTEYIDEFIVLAQYECFSEAARRLSVSQSTLSKHIAKLEGELGFDLVARTIPVSLTSAGRLFLDGIQPIRSNINELISNCRTASSDQKSELKIQSYPFDSYIQNLVLRSADEIVYSFPAINICTVDLEDPPDIALGKGDIDIGFLFDFGELSDCLASIEEDGLVPIPIMRDFNTLAMRNDNPLAALEAISVADLKDTPIMFNTLGVSSGSLKDAIRKLCVSNGFEPIFRTRSLTFANDFLALDPGNAVYLVTNTTSTSFFEARPSMVLRQLDTGGSDRRIWAFFVHKPNNDSPALKKFVSTLKDQAYKSLLVNDSAATKGTTASVAGQDRNAASAMAG